MKKTIFFIAALFCMSQSMMAIKPLLTEGYDKYNNSIKLDLVSVGYMSPQIVWEHYTNTRFSFGVSAQAHFMNRSNAVRTWDNGETRPSEVKLDKRTYQVIWDGHRHPMGWYADVSMDDGTHEIKWDRKYVGVMVCPEGRYYFGRKPHRGFYFVARVDMGLFDEMFDVSYATLNWEYIDGLTAEEKETDPVYQRYQKNQWRRGNVEKGETFLALGVGGGFGFQGWFKQNSHWGFDLNCFAKSDWKLSADDNVWEWFWGAGSPIDANASIIYRF